MKKPKKSKRGRKLGVKVGPYINLRKMMLELIELRKKVAKLEKVLH